MRAALRPMVVAALFLLVGAISAEAASATWTGNTSGSWQTPTNWTPNTTPGAGNTVTFANTATTDTITTTGSVTIANIVINAGTSGTLYETAGAGGFNGASVLTITGAAGISNASVVGNPTTLDLGNVTLGGSQTWGGWVNVGESIQSGGIDTLVLGASHTLTFNGIAGSSNLINVQITGTGTSGLSLTGAGTVELNQSTSTFTGGVVLNGSASTTTLNPIGGPGALGTGTLTLTNGTLEITTAGTYTNAISLNGGAASTVTFAAPSTPTTWSGAMSTTGANGKSLVFTGAATTFTGLFSGTQSMTVTGSSSGSMVLGGSTANTYSGAVTIGSGGIVTLAKTGGTSGTPVAALASGSITVNTGGTLGLGTNYTTTTTNALTLAGGTFKSAGFSTALGTLTLTATSTIDLGNASSVINFATGSPAWTAGTTLDITGWNTNTQLFFGTTAGGLTAGQVNQILFINPGGYAAGNYYAQILSTGKVVPRIPEPSTIAMGVALAALAALWEIKRRRGVLAKNS